MANTRLVTADVGGVNQSFNITNYCLFGHSTIFVTTTENKVQRTFNIGGTLSNLFVYVSTNTITTSATTVNTRKNVAGNGNLTVSIAAAATGIFEDISNSDTVTSGEEWNYSLVTPNTSGSINWRSISIIFSATTNTYGFFALNNASNVSQADSNADDQGLTGIIDITPGSTVKYDFMVAGTIKHGFAYVSANTNTTAATTLQLEINAGNGTIVMSIAAAATGIFEDVAHTDAIVDGDDVGWNYAVAANAGSTTTTLDHLSLGFETTNNQFMFGWKEPNLVTQATNITRYYALCDRTANPAENVTGVTSRLSNAVAKELEINVSANTFTTLATTVTFRQNATTDSLTISIAAAGTGIFATTGTTTIATTDEINYKIITPNQAGTLTTEQMSSLIDCTPAAVTKTFTIDIVLKKLALTKTFILDTVLKKLDILKTLTIDTILKKLNITKTLTIDAVLKKLAVLKTFTIDIVLKKLDIPKTLTIDTILKKLSIPKTLTIDTVLKKLAVLKTFTIDTVLTSPAVTKTFTIDTILKKLGVLKTLTLDAVLLKQFTKTLTIDVVLKKVFTKTLTLDTILKKVNILKTLTVDTVLKKFDVPRTLTFDTVLKKLAIPKTLTIDTVLKKTGILKTLTFDTVLKKLSIPKTLTIDAVLKKLTILKTFTIDTVLTQTVVTTKTFTLDAVLKKLGILQTFTIDVVLTGLEAEIVYTGGPYKTLNIIKVTRSLMFKANLIAPQTLPITIQIPIKQRIRLKIDSLINLTKKNTKSLRIESILVKKENKFFSLNVKLNANMQKVLERKDKLSFNRIKKLLLLGFLDND